MQTGRQFFVPEREHRFYQPSDSGRSIEMAEVCLDRADGTESFPVRAMTKSLRESFNLDRVPELSSGSVSFNIADR